MVQDVTAIRPGEVGFDAEWCPRDEIGRDADIVVCSGYNGLWISRNDCESVNILAGESVVNGPPALAAIVGFVSTE